MMLNKKSARMIRMTAAFILCFFTWNEVTLQAQVSRFAPNPAAGYASQLPASIEEI